MSPEEYRTRDTLAASPSTTNWAIPAPKLWPKVDFQKFTKNRFHDVAQTVSVKQLSDSVIVSVEYSDTDSLLFPYMTMCLVYLCENIWKL